jgi:hypothetical protein
LCAGAWYKKKNGRVQQTTAVGGGCVQSKQRVPPPQPKKSNKTPVPAITKVITTPEKQLYASPHNDPISFSTSFFQFWCQTNKDRSLHRALNMAKVG